MRQARIVTPLLRRTGVRMTGMAVILAGSGLVLSGAAPAAGQQVTRASAAYTCSSPSGWNPIPAQVAVSIPQAVTAGQPIRPTAATVTLSLPRADRARLGKLRAKSVNVAAQLRGQAMENGKSAADPWAVKAASATVPSQGGLALHLPATVRPVTEVKAGNAAFAVPDLSLLLAPQTARGATAAPAAMRLDCTLDPGQPATLATVPVLAAARGATAAPATAAGHFLTGLWQSAPGGNVTGKSKKVTLKDTTTGTVISCTSSSIGGTFKFGQQLAKAGIGSVSSVTVLTCTGPGGRTFTITSAASASHPWLLNAQSWDATTTNTTLTVSGITASISGTGCTASVAGLSSASPGTLMATNSVNAFNDTDTLNVGSSGGTLHVWNVSGCSGLFKSGDAFSLTASYKLSQADYIAPAYCPPFPVKKGFPFNPLFKLPNYPHKGAIVSHAPPAPPEQACAFIEGFSDVQKLGEAAFVGPGFGNIQDGRRTIINPSHHFYFQTDSAGKLYYKPCLGSSPQCRAIAGLPPVHATFLSFGFMPTTATLQITEPGTLNIVTVGGVKHGVQVLKFSKVQSLASIRIENVSVNGTPLDVGTNCHTVRPFPLVLTGKPPYQLQTGGVLRGTITVPSFTGCGVGENLDPIFDASVSGSGNFVQLTQGSLCVSWTATGAFPSNCPAAVRKPIR
jgi:hypothetical protein